MRNLTYVQASEMLQKSKGAVSQAVKRGVLTRLNVPFPGHFVAEEQVRIFVGKELSLQALSINEREEWYKVNDAIKAEKQVVDIGEMKRAYNTLEDTHRYLTQVEGKVDEALKNVGGTSAFDSILELNPHLVDTMTYLTDKQPMYARMLALHLLTALEFASIKAREKFLQGLNVQERTLLKKFLVEHISKLLDAA